MSGDLGKLTRAPPVHKSVQDAIRAYIVERGLKPGDSMLPEGELARRLGVSRNSVREAVRSLESLGVLESRHGSGLYVREFTWDPILDNLAYGLIQDVSSLAELLDIRRVLEVGMAEAAVARLTDDQLMRLEGLLERMNAHAAEGRAFPDEDREFHRVLFGRLQNLTFLKLLDIFWLAFRRASRGTDLLDLDPQATQEAHVRIVEALRSRGVDQVRAALEDHYRFITERLKSQLAPDAGPSGVHREEARSDEPLTGHSDTDTTLEER